MEWLADPHLVPIDRNLTRAVSPFRRPVLVASGSIEELICFYDELSQDQIPENFVEMLLSEASPALTAEFLSQRTQLQLLSQLFEKSPSACEHILQSDDLHAYGGLSFLVVKDMALVAKSRHCANAALEEMESESSSL